MSLDDNADGPGWGSVKEVPYIYAFADADCYRSNNTHHFAIVLKAYRCIHVLSEQSQSSGASLSYTIQGPIQIRTGAV